MQRTVSSVSLGFMITLSLVLCDLTLAGTRPRGRTLVSPQQSTNQTGVRSTKLAQDRGWPRGYSLPSEAQIVLFEPQFASWENQKLAVAFAAVRSEEHTSELQSPCNLVCRLLLEKKNTQSSSA